ncbi:hypothetical protein [Streptacidiphilus albus]|nr:hypothetical protein [Streptacidiphilus albus]
MNLTLVEQKLLDGAHWFQLWDGEIVSIASPELREDEPAAI